MPVPRARHNFALLLFARNPSSTAARTRIHRSSGPCTAAATAPPADQAASDQRQDTSRRRTSHQSASFVFSEHFNNTGFHGGHTSGLFFWLYVLPIGFILTMYTQTGYDASAHTAEETRGAALGAAKGVWKSIFYSALLGWFLLLAFLFAATDPKAVAGDPDSFRGYVQTQRLERCKRDLGDPAYQARHIGEIAFAWGFNDLAHFSRIFKQRFGVSPREWREQPRQ